MMTITVLLFCLAGFAASQAQAGASQWYLGKRYPLVRSKLIAQGYRPLHLKHPASDLFCYDDDLCRRFPEVFSCTVGGAPFCRFALLRLADGKYVVVTTHGEDWFAIDSLEKASGIDLDLIAEHRR